MKKIYNYLFIGIVAMLSMTLSSCNNDDYDAGLLAGYWEGDITSVGWRTETFNYVDFYFEKDPSYGRGHGWERDYDASGYIVAESEFDYEVVNGSLKLTYYSPYIVVWIDNWTISRDDRWMSAKFRYKGNTVTWNLRRIGGWRSVNYYPYSTDVKLDSVAAKTESENK